MIESIVLKFDILVQYNACPEEAELCKIHFRSNPRWRTSPIL